VQADGNYDTGWISLQGRGTGFYWYNFSAKREFWSKKASLTLGVSNPFNRGVRQTFRQSAPTFTTEARNFFVTAQPPPRLRVALRPDDRRGWRQAEQKDQQRRQGRKVVGQ
jgi:hypothetical protein